MSIGVFGSRMSLRLESRVRGLRLDLKGPRFMLVDTKKPLKSCNRARVQKALLV